MKIANKISLSFFVTVLILVIVTISVVYVETKDFLQDAISAHLITTAESRVRHVETFLETQKDRIIQLSQSIVIRGFLSADKRDAAYKKHYNNTIKRLQGTEKIFKDVDEIFVLDVNGKIVASSNEREIGLDRSGNAYFLGGKLDSYIKDIYLSKATDEKSFAVSAPIMDEKTGNLLGVVVARIGLDLLEKITTDNAGLGKTGEIFLVNQYGYVITPLRFIKETFLIRKIDSEDMKKALSHIKRNSDKPFAHYPFLYKDYRGVRVFGMHQHIAGIKGVLFAKIDEKEVMAPLLRLKILFASAVVIILLIAWLLGSVIARFIVGPIHELHKGTEIVGSGDLNYEVGTQSNDEIGQLSRAFDKMTENLRETSVSKDYVNNIIETMTGSLVVMDSKGIITDVNRATCDLLGYPEEELIGEDISLLFPEEEKIPLKGTQLEKLIKKGLLINYETYYVIKEGSKIPVLLSGAVMRNKEGDVTNIVCIAKDVTEEKGFKLELVEKSKELEMKNRNLIQNEMALKNMMYDMKETSDALKRAQGQLIQSEKMASVGQLAAGVAHEINNPLGYIINNLETLKKYVNKVLQTMSVYDGLKNALLRKDTEKAMKAGEQILATEEGLNIEHIRADSGDLIKETLDGARRIELIVSDLKMFSRTGGKEKKPADINEVLKRVVNVVWNEIKYTAQLKEEYGPIPEIMCDEQHLSQVFVNLLINSCYAVKGVAGVISIRTYCQDKHVCVEIDDTGEGIPEDILGKIFDPFFTTKEQGAGTGLGLSVSHEIIEKHGGTIAVNSTVGKGTRFLVSLPVILY